MYIELNIVFIELVKDMLYIELIGFMELMKKRSYENESLFKNKKKIVSYSAKFCLFFRECKWGKFNRYGFCLLWYYIEIYSFDE